jgi:hypothetical protein
MSATLQRRLAIGSSLEAEYVCAVFQDDWTRRRHEPSSGMSNVPLNDSDRDRAYDFGERIGVPHSL